MLHCFGHASGTHGRQRRGGVGVRQFGHQRDHLVKIIPVQRLGGHPCEIGLGQKQLKRAGLYLPARRGLAALVKGQPQTRLHQIVDGCIGGPRVESQQRAFRLGQGDRRIHPGQVPHPAKVQKGHRPRQPRIAGAGVVKKRRERCALSAQMHIGAAEIPHDGQPQMIRQRCTIAHLQRPLHARRMGQRLPVKADQIDIGIRAKGIDMRRLDHLRRRRHLWP